MALGIGLRADRTVNGFADLGANSSRD